MILFFRSADRAEAACYSGEASPAGRLCLALFANWDLDFFFNNAPVTRSIVSRAESISSYRDDNYIRNPVLFSVYIFGTLRSQEIQNRVLKEYTYLLTNWQHGEVHSTNGAKKRLTDTVNSELHTCVISIAGRADAAQSSRRPSSQQSARRACSRASYSGACECRSG